MNFAVSTAKKPNADLMEKARGLCEQYHLPFLHRSKNSIESLLKENKLDALLIVESNRLLLKGDNFTFFWHPSTAKMTTGELETLPNTALIKALSLKPSSHVLDCTLGLGSDALRIAMALSESGKITGIEGSPMIGLLTKEGLKTLAHTQRDNLPEHSVMPPEALIEASQKIEVIQMDHMAFLKSAADRSFDTVYFDPMFEEPGYEAHSVNAFRRFANHSELSVTTIQEAIRVCREGVVVKERFGSECFKRLGVTDYIGDLHHGRVVYGRIKKV